MSSAPYANYGDAFRGYDQPSSPHSRRVNGANPAPYMNVGQSAQPSVQSPSMPAAPMGQPAQTPQFTPEQVMRQKNMGIRQREPSPGSTLGLAQAAANPPPSMPAGASGGQQAPYYRAGSAEWGRINRAYHDAQKVLVDMDEKSPGFAEHSAYVASLRGQLGMGGQQPPGTGSGMAVPFHPMSNGAAPAAPGAATPRAPMPGESAPGVPLPPSDKYVRRGPALAPEAPQDPSARQAAIRTMYATAAADLDKNPGLGTTGIPAPKTQFTYSDTAAHKAVEMGPGQQKRNEGAMLRGAERERQAGVDKNAAQFAQNQQAAQNIGKRELNFEQGDYNLAHAPGQPQPAGGAVASGQPQQQRLDASNPQHVQIANQLLQQAGGDKNKARQLAAQQGYGF